MSSETETSKELGTCERWALGLLGALCISFSMLIGRVLPDSVTHKTDNVSKIEKTVTSSGDPGNLPLAFLLSGSCMLLLSLNGLRISRFAAGGLDIQTSTSATSSANKSLDNPDQEIVEVPSQIVPPEPTQSDGTIVKNGEKYRIYTLHNTPFKVIRDLFSNWPEEIEAPADLGSFEFASKKAGKGSHTWSVQFRDRPRISVSYGGQGKKDPTVSQRSDENPALRS